MEQRTFYNRNGLIIKKNAQEDSAFVEIEVEFSRLVEIDTQLLLCITAFYMLFKEDEGIDYVMSSWTLQKCVVRNDAFTDVLAEKLINTILSIQNRLGLLRRLADDHFYVDGNGGNIETNKDESLKKFKVADCMGKKFVERFSEEFRD